DRKQWRTFHENTRILLCTKLGDIWCRKPELFLPHFWHSVPRSDGLVPTSGFWLLASGFLFTQESHPRIPFCFRGKKGAAKHNESFEVSQQHETDGHEVGPLRVLHVHPRKDERVNQPYQFGNHSHQNGCRHRLHGVDSLIRQEFVEGKDCYDEKASHRRVNDEIARGISHDLERQDVHHKVKRSRDRNKDHCQHGANHG